MPEILEATEALRLLDEVVEQFGEDYVDPSARDSIEVCRYWSQDKTGCIVGQVLHRHGYSDADIGGLDGQGAVYNLPTRRLMFTEKALAILSAAQGFQDQAQSWGAARLQARRVALELGVIESL